MNLQKHKVLIRQKAITQLEAEIRTLQAAYDESSQTVNQYSTDIETYTTASAEAVKGNVEGVIAVLTKKTTVLMKKRLLQQTNQQSNKSKRQDNITSRQ